MNRQVTLEPLLDLTEEEKAFAILMKALYKPQVARRDWEMRIMKIMYQVSREIQIENAERIK